MAQMARRHFALGGSRSTLGSEHEWRLRMQSVDREIDWTRASDDFGLMEECRAAASVAAQFESARSAAKTRLSTFDEIFRWLYKSVRSSSRGGQSS